MASGVTNKCRHDELDIIYRGASAPANFWLALCTAAIPPTEDTNTLGELTEIAAGAGYTTGGISLARNSTDFPTLTEDDTNDKAILAIKSITLTATGGPIPLSGSGVAFAVLCTPHATVSSRPVWRWWDLRDEGGNARVVSATQSLIFPELITERRKAA